MCGFQLQISNFSTQYFFDNNIFRHCSESQKFKVGNWSTTPLILRVTCAKFRGRYVSILSVTHETCGNNRDERTKTEFQVNVLQLQLKFSVFFFSKRCYYNGFIFAKSLTRKSRPISFVDITSFTILFIFICLFIIRSMRISIKKTAHPKQHCTGR